MSMAEKLAGLYSRPPIPVLEVAQRNGVKVFPETFNKLRDSVAGFCDFKSETIYVNIEDPPERQSFTIAHELGHWMLHRTLFRQHSELYKPLPRFREPPPSVLETEAHHFASYLLVPKRLLVPVRNAAPAELARIFQVPLELMERRLTNG